MFEVCTVQTTTTTLESRRGAPHRTSMRRYVREAVSTTVMTVAVIVGTMWNVRSRVKVAAIIPGGSNNNRVMRLLLLLLQVEQVHAFFVD